MPRPLAQDSRQTVSISTLAIDDFSVLTNHERRQHYWRIHVIHSSAGIYTRGRYQRPTGEGDVDEEQGSSSPYGEPPSFILLMSPHLTLGQPTCTAVHHSMEFVPRDQKVRYPTVSDVIKCA